MHTYHIHIIWCVYIYIYIHVHTYIHIYIYICTPHPAPRRSSRSRSEPCLRGDAHGVFGLSKILIRLFDLVFSGMVYSSCPKGLCLFHSSRKLSKNVCVAASSVPPRPWRSPLCRVTLWEGSMKHRSVPKEKCPQCSSLWGSLGDTPPLRNRQSLGPCKAP